MNKYQSTSEMQNNACGERASERERQREGEKERENANFEPKEQKQSGFVLSTLQ